MLGTLEYPIDNWYRLVMVLAGVANLLEIDCDYGLARLYRQLDNSALVVMRIRARPKGEAATVDKYQHWQSGGGTLIAVLWQGDIQVQAIQVGHGRNVKLGNGLLNQLHFKVNCTMWHDNRWTMLQSALIAAPFMDKLIPVLCGCKLTLGGVIHNLRISEPILERSILETEALDDPIAIFDANMPNGRVV